MTFVSAWLEGQGLFPPTLWAQHEIILDYACTAFEFEDVNYCQFICLSSTLHQSHPTQGLESLKPHGANHLRDISEKPLGERMMR